MKKDYFAILGLKPSASDKEIRSAYKKLAKKYHPDVNPNNKQAEEKFKEISEAYDVLTDAEKRRRWESGDFDFEAFAREAARERARGGGAGGADPFSTFRFEGGDLGSILGDLFGGMGGAGGMGGRQTGRRGRGMRAQGTDLQFQTRLTFEQAIHGTTLTIPLARMASCPTCSGEGTLPNGSACTECGGSGSRRLSETIQVRIPPGAEDGSKVRVAGKGEAGPGGGPPGDLYVVLQVEPHPYFRRDGRDVILEVPLTIAEAALGTRIEVPTVDGRVTLTVPPGSSSGRKLRLKGRGVASRNGASRGDQIVVLQIVPPPASDEKARKLLEDLDKLNPIRPRDGLGWWPNQT